MKKLLVLVCSICPLCIARRKWPTSGYGRFMARVEQICPFCRAYDQLHGEEKKKGDSIQA